MLRKQGEVHLEAVLDLQGDAADPLVTVEADQGLEVNQVIPGHHDADPGLHDDFDLDLVVDQDHNS